MGMDLLDAGALDALLPQLQCGRCGYGACAPYAAALAAGTAPTDRCGPGGAAVATALARALRRPVLAPDPACGGPIPAQVAWIDPEVCIGCTRCLDACPVDAIFGARRLLHGIVAEQCTGCELCLPPCPVDCIHLLALPAEALAPAAREGRGALAAHRYQARLRRLNLPAPTGPGAVPTPAPAGAEGALPPRASQDREKSSEVLEAIARARAIAARQRSGEL